MPETKFTPGPWLVFDHYCGRDPKTAGEYANHRIVGIGQFDTVAEVRHGHDEIEGDVDANAHLISAAPELYSACVRLLEAQDAGDDVAASWAHIDMRAALGKARGEA